MTLISLPILLGTTAVQCPFDGDAVKANGFTQINRNGFGYVENFIDMNDYPWGMKYFQADGAKEGHVYVSTGNGIDDQVLYQLGQLSLPVPPLRPGEVRRYRPDIGPRSWQSSLDIRNFEAGPVFDTTGFRSLQVFKPSEKKPTYLYAGSMSAKPALWRTRTGEPGSWKKVWEFPERGSIRAMTVHNGLLYFGLIPGGEIGDGTPGQLWVHDGQNTWQIVDDGFGDFANLSVWSMASFNGYLYVSMANVLTGFEVWKLEGVGDKAGPPVRVVNHGGDWRGNYAAVTCYVFQDHLYFGTQILAGLNTSADGPLLRGGDVIRLDADDHMQVVIGPDSISGIGSGFGKAQNAYIWSMTEYQGELYIGTWDQTSIVQYVIDYYPESIDELIAFLSTDWDLPGGGLSGKDAIDQFIANGANVGDKRRPTFVSGALDMGGDLYKSPDGEHWDTVFTDGLGDPYNYGPRNLLAVGDDLYVGMANIYEGLEIWRKKGAAEADAR